MSGLLGTRDTSPFRTSHWRCIESFLGLVRKRNVDSNGIDARNLRVFVWAQNTHTWIGDFQVPLDIFCIHLQSVIGY